MSEAAFEALEAEAYEGDAEAEAYEAEAYGDAWGDAGWDAYGEASRAEQRRRRQIVDARRRQRQRQAPARRAPQPPQVPPRSSGRPSPATVRVRAVDLENKAELDSMRRAIDEANRRATRSMYSALATGAVGQALDTYQETLADHEFVRAAARFAPLALLPGDQNKKGVEGFLLHPAFLSGALIGGIFLVGKFTNSKPGVADVRVSPNSVQAKQTGRFVGYPVDKEGRTLSDVTVTWESTDQAVLKVDPVTGEYKAGDETRSVTVIASAKDVRIPITVTVVPAPGWGLAMQSVGDPSQGQGPATQDQGPATQNQDTATQGQDTSQNPS
ncbi:hypothetical protein ACWCQK_26365 [Streptomyces sp. NPDC002306]